MGKMEQIIKEAIDPEGDLIDRIAALEAENADLTQRLEAVGDCLRALLSKNDLPPLA